MQAYAEQSVTEHMKTLQKSFFREKKGVASAPYSTNREEVSAAAIKSMIDRAVKQTERYRLMKKAGASDAEINKAFNTPTDMRAFSYDGVIDTIMTPLDSILYTKHFLRTGFMSMDPKNGHVKAYVGGPNFSFSSMTWCRQAAARSDRPSSHFFTHMPWRRATPHATSS